MQGLTWMEMQLIGNDLQHYLLLGSEPRCHQSRGNLVDAADILKAWEQGLYIRGEPSTPEVEGFIIIDL